MAQILRALLEQRTWRQDELARHLDLTARTIRERLEEMGASGFRLERQEEPPYVYWSVPPDWLPGAVTLNAAQVSGALKLLVRVPKSEPRDELLRLLTGALPVGAGRAPTIDGAVSAPATTAREEAILSAVLDARWRRQSLRILYGSTHAEEPSWRHISVQQVRPGPPVRIAAWCHRRDALRWFRGDRIAEALPDARIPWRDVPTEEVREFVARSPHGFVGDAIARCVFAVRNPEARWVRANLPDPAAGRYDVADTAEGIRVTVTASVDQIARYVVGLGAAARAETPELAAEVARLALGALRNGRDPTE